MLSLREQAAGLARESLGGGRGRVLGGDPVTTTAGRLDVARRALRLLRAALDTERTRFLEPTDDVLNSLAARVEALARELESDAERYGKGQQHTVSPTVW